MEYNRSEMQHHPPQKPQHVNPYSNHINTTHYAISYSHYHLPNPNPNTNPNPPIEPLKPHEAHYSLGYDRDLRPPEVHQLYTCVSSLAQSHVGVGGYKAYQYQQLHVAYAPHHQTLDTGAVAVPSGYYQDPNAIPAVQNLGAKEVFRHYGSSPYATSGVTILPNVTEQLVASHVNSTWWTNPTVWPRGSKTWKRGPKKTKIVQSAWCEVCKVECSSKDVLDNHKVGKKHKKNLEKLKEAIAPALVASGVSYNPEIGPPENPDKGKAASVQKTRKKAAAEPVVVEVLETKRRKILEGGAAVEAVRTCTICNVVCNSKTVLKYHLAGQKHATMMKKHAGGAGVVIAS